MKESKGFTVLELLIVVAIIGILAAIVLGQVKSAKARAQDKAIAENLLSARSEMGLYYSNNGTYGQYGFTGTTFVTGNSSKCFAETSGTGTSVFNNGSSAHSIKLVAIAGEANSQSGGTIIDLTTDKLTNAKCASYGNTAAVSVTLATNTAQSWCIDSSGFSGVVDGSSTNSATTTFIYDAVNNAITCNI